MEEVLRSRLSSVDIDQLDLQESVVICSRREECNEVNKRCLARIPGDSKCYSANDTDHHGNPLRDPDLQHLSRTRERLPDKVILKVGCRVVLRRNINFEEGWINGTLAVVTSMTDQCVILRQISNNNRRMPLTRFRQRISIPGASYSILRMQFPLELAYAVTVHRVQGLTVRKAIVMLNKNFFESG